MRNRLEMGDGRLEIGDWRWENRWEIGDGKIKGLKILIIC
jgi:hypothetical protein